MAVLILATAFSTAVTKPPGGLPTLPRDGEFAEYFPQNHGGRGFHGTARRPGSAAKKPRLAARKIARTDAAFSLPHDSHIALMFGPPGFGERALNASRGLGFHIVPRRRCLPQRLGTPRKCFNQQRIFDATRCLAARCGINACSGAVFCKRRCAGGRGLPLVCRKAPEVCRKTRQFKSVGWTREPKSFSRHSISSSAEMQFRSVSSW